MLFFGNSIINTFSSILIYLFLPLILKVRLLEFTVDRKCEDDLGQYIEGIELFKKQTPFYHGRSYGQKRKVLQKCRILFAIELSIQLLDLPSIVGLWFDLLSFTIQNNGQKIWIVKSSYAYTSITYNTQIKLFVDFFHILPNKL